MLSLPIPDYEKVTFFLYFIYQSRTKTPNKITYSLPEYHSSKDIKLLLEQELGISAANIKFTLLKDHKIIEIPKEDASVK